MVNSDGTIFLDLFRLGGQPLRDGMTEISPTPFLAYITAASYFEQRWEAFEEAWGKEATDKYRSVRDAGYIPTTRAGILVPNGDNVRAPLLEADLVASYPDEFAILLPERGFAPEGAHIGTGEIDSGEVLPRIVSELASTNLRDLLEVSAGVQRPLDAELRRGIAEYQASYVSE